MVYLATAASSGLSPEATGEPAALLVAVALVAIVVAIARLAGRQQEAMQPARIELEWQPLKSDRSAG